jgi:cytochrome c553
LRRYDLEVKTMRRILLGLAVTILIAGIVLYIWSGAILRRVYDVPLRAIVASTDSVSIAEGERLARMRGCPGCHGQRLEGELFINEPLLARIWTSNLTLSARDLTDGELDRIIRRGVRPNGRSVLVMPSDMFAELADEDMAKILGYVRSLPVIDSLRPQARVGPIARLGLVLGKYSPTASIVRRSPAATVPRDVETEWGGYLARTMCTECHGADLHGEPGNSPDLRIAAGYSEPDWLRLMRQGRGLGDRDLGLMSEVARGRFSLMSDEETRALRAYLRTLAAN